jgi:hypothetical protein
LHELFEIFGEGAPTQAAGRKIIDITHVMLYRRMHITHDLQCFAAFVPGPIVFELADNDIFFIVVPLNGDIGGHNWMHTFLAKIYLTIIKQHCSPTKDENQQKRCKNVV